MTQLQVNSRLTLWLAGVTLVGLGYGLAHVRAEGAPKTQPLWYAGTVADAAGAPLEGEHSVTLRLFPALTGGSPACATAPIAVVFQKGRFRLDASAGACMTAISGTSDLFAELSVDDKTFPRSKIAAVPFALEAARASAAAGALAQQVVPAGAVMAFDLDACPAGWTRMAEASGRVVVGVKDGATGVARRAVIGADSVTLDVAQMPGHLHTGTTGPGKAMTYRVVAAIGTQGAANHGPGYTSNNPFVESTNAEYPMAGHAHDFTTNSVGGGRPFDNRQASIALLYCRKD